jgi:DNA-binding response OmpR family regulator
MSSGEFRQVRGAGSVAHQVLLVEDDASIATYYKELLERHGYRVSIAKNGGQAMSTFAMRRPDFVILDLILPGESGFEICERMKQNDETVPVMVLSAIDMDDSRSLARRVGADGYLAKPCEPAELIETIQDIAQKVWERAHADRPKEEKRVRFNCECGKRFKVSPIHRGRTLTCPDCGETLVIPRHG